MKQLSLLSVLLLMICGSGCVHRTSMSDPLLRGLWRGQPLDSKAVEDAAVRWPKDVTLIEMQQAFALLRNGNFSQEARADAKRYFERATQSFDDLKQPNNFSVAFTADANTPYRGRPYERVLASMFLGVLDIADGRCDMAIPSLKSAEFLDARWQPFQYGTDAPLVYALSLRCLKQMRAAEGDISRAKEGLFRSIRMLDGLDDIRNSVEGLARDLERKDPAVQVSFVILDAGISSSLMESAHNATAAEILDRVVTDSLRFYVQVLSNKDDSMFDTLQVFAKKVEKSVGSKDKVPSAQALASIEAALRGIIARADSGGRLTAALESKIMQAHTKTEAIYAAVSGSKTIVSFAGIGPIVVAEGEYKEVARVVPSSQKNAKPSAEMVQIKVAESCGVHQRENGGVDFVLCDESAMKRSEIKKDDQESLWSGIKLWSSSYQATSMVGRRFDKILKGRAEFRMGTETAALIGAATAVALFAAGNEYARQCQTTGRNCEAAQNLQVAGAVAGLIAGGIWLAGRSVNPEADIRHVSDAYESGYLMLRRKE